MSGKSERTKNNLELAVTRIINGRPKVVAKNKKLSITSVAEEAGVSTSLIHNRHQDILDLIKSKSANNDRQKAEKKKEQLKKERDRTSELRSESQELQDQVQKLTSINARLTAENEHMKAIIDNPNIAVLNTKKR